MQTKEQKRSAFALKQVEDSFGIPVEKDAANFVVGVPTMVLANGLGQTLAFLLSKQKKDGKKEKKDHHKMTFNVMQQWLGQDIPALNVATDFEFLQRVAGLDQKTYLQAQREALAMLQWLKRYVRAFEKEDKEMKQ